MPYQPTPDILIEHDGPVAIVTMNNPEQRNAFTDDMHQGMREVWEFLAMDRSVRSIILTGAGKAFSAGGDVPGFIKAYESLQTRREQMRGAQRLQYAMLECPKPMIAAINGPAVGLGCSVAVGCDFVIMAESAFIADPHVSIGLVAGDGGAATWPVMINMLKAKYYLLTGERIPAKECVEIGLATKWVPDDKLMEESLALAHQLAKQPQQAIEETKRAINLHLIDAVNKVAPFACAAEQESFSTDDIKRTIDSFKK